jgi:hypothetical protein
VILHTFIHLSDLHVHEDPVYERELSTQLVPRFPGVAGHDDEALAAVWRLYRNDGFRDLVADGRAHLIFTGDLTALGTTPQFGVGKDFLGGLGTTIRPGLNNGRWGETAIPGNHDHWGTFLWFGPEAPEFTTLFPFRSTFSPVLPIGYGFSVRFIRIDGDADSGGNRLPRVLARGVFAKAVQEIKLPPRDPKEVRVLLLHHSISHRNEHALLRPLPGYPVCYVPNGESERALVDFLLEHEVTVVLTGHIHESRLRQLTIGNKTRGPGRVLEARCGTTTQQHIDSFAAQVWGKTAARLARRGRRGPRTAGEHSILVHELELNAEGLSWNTHLYRRMEGKGFTKFLPDVPDSAKSISMRVFPPSPASSKSQ